MHLCVHTTLYVFVNLQSSANISHFNLISLIHKLTTGKEYASSCDVAMMYPLQRVSSPQDSCIDCSCSNQHMTANKLKKENRLDKELKGPLFTGQYLHQYTVE